MIIKIITNCFIKKLIKFKPNFYSLKKIINKQKIQIKVLLKKKI